MAGLPENLVKAPDHSPTYAHPAWLILIVSLAPTIGLGIGRFAYSLVLPDMRDALGWSYSAAGFMNTINAIGYLAGALLASRTMSAQANLGAGMELTAISAAVVGGTSIFGGDGAVWRGFLGVMLLAIIGNGFNLLNIDTTYQQIVYGGLILVAVAADQLLRRRA